MWRKRRAIASSGQLAEFRIRRNGEEEVLRPWRPALIVIDMWDDYWCKERARRYDSLAKKIGEAIKGFRRLGGAVVHAPSATMLHYEGTPARREARRFVPMRLPWRRQADAPRLHVDVECDCDPKCLYREDFLHAEHPAVGIVEGDLISDSAPEIYTWLKRRGSQMLLFAGISLDMCVLDRPFGIIAASSWGIPVAVVRDLTEPFDWKRGDEVIRFIETWHCGSLESAQLASARVRGDVA